MLTLGAGFALARLDVYYGDDGVNNFVNYFAFARIKPVKPVLFSLKVENRSTIFAEVDTRVLANLSLTFSRPGGHDYHF